MNDNTTTNSILSTMSINLTDMENVANAIKSSMNTDKFGEIGNIKDMISPEKIMEMIKTQSTLMSQMLNNMPSTSLLGPGGTQNTLNTALSSVLNAVNCSVLNVNENFNKIKDLSNQVESLQTMLKNGDIESLKNLKVP